MQTFSKKMSKTLMFLLKFRLVTKILSMELEIYY